MFLQLVPSAYTADVRNVAICVNTRLHTVSPRVRVARGGSKGTAGGTCPQSPKYKHNTALSCLQVYGHYGNFKRLALLVLYYFTTLMQWPACQNTADCTALVRRDYIPEPAAVVDHFARSGAHSLRSAFCILRQNWLETKR